MAFKVIGDHLPGGGRADGNAATKIYSPV